MLGLASGNLANEGTLFLQFLKMINTCNRSLHKFEETPNVEK